MRFNCLADDLLGTRAKVRIARTLFTTPRKENSGRELAMLAKVSLPQAGEALRAMEANGIVSRRIYGRAIVWTVNVNNRGSELLSNLFRDEKKLFADVKKHIAAVLGPVSEKVVLFGSTSRGEDNASSDMDICIITTDKRRAEPKLKEIQLELLEKYNILLSPLLYSPSEYLRSTVVKEGEVLCEQDLLRNTNTKISCRKRPNTMTK